MNNLVDKNENSYVVGLENNFDFLSDEYRQLFENSTATVFQSPFWLSAFYNNLAEASGAQLHIVTLRDADRLLCFVLPCIKQKFKFLTVVQPADLGVADYNSFVANKKTHLRLRSDKKLCAELLAALKPYDVFFFRKQREDGPQIQEIFPGGQTLKNDFNSHEVKIGGDFDAWYSEMLSKNFRKQNRRKTNNLERDLGGMEVSLLEDSAEISKALMFIREQRGARYEDDILHQENYFEFYKSVCRKFASTGDVIVSVGVIQGKIVTAEMGVVLNGTYSCLLAAFLPHTYDKYSIGLVSILELMKILVPGGIETYDFALGDENYKKKFGAEGIRIDNVIYSGTLLGTLLYYIYRYAKPLKDYLKKFIPSLK